MSSAVTVFLPAIIFFVLYIIMVFVLNKYSNSKLATIAFTIVGLLILVYILFFIFTFVM